MNISRVGEIGVGDTVVGKLGQIKGETRVGEMGEAKGEHRKVARRNATKTLTASL